MRRIREIYVVNFEVTIDLHWIHAILSRTFKRDADVII